MNYITTTDLRTKSSELIRTLKQGTKVSLIHRSRVVGMIEPVAEPKTMTTEGIKHLQELAKRLNLPKLSYKEREKRYRAEMMKKHGQSLS